MKRVNNPVPRDHNADIRLDGPPVAPAIGQAEATARVNQIGGNEIPVKPGSPVMVALMAIALVAAGFSGSAGGAEAPDDTLAARGKRIFLRCASCHNIGVSDIQRIGPDLDGVVGRKAGSLPGYSYSPAMAKADLVWDEGTLDRWLEQPTALVPGTAMAFAGLPKPDDRKAVIRYLETAGR